MVRSTNSFYFFNWFQVDEVSSKIVEPRCAPAQAQLKLNISDDSPAKKRKNDANNDCNLLTGMAPVQQGVSAAAGVANNPSAPGTITGHQLWANLLALKMDKMTPRNAEDFKVRVDRMAVDLMELD